MVILLAVLIARGKVCTLICALAKPCPGFGPKFLLHRFARA